MRVVYRRVAHERMSEKNDASYNHVEQEKGTRTANLDAKRDLWVMKYRQLVSSIERWQLGNSWVGLSVSVGSSAKIVATIVTPIDAPGKICSTEIIELTSLGYFRHY